nr:MULTISPECIES: hypothetical protein [unclassified Pseudomonas]
MLLAQESEQVDLNTQHVIHDVEIALGQVYLRFKQRLSRGCQRQSLRTVLRPHCQHAHQAAQGLRVEAGALARQ